MFLTGLAITTAFVLLAIIAPLVAPHDPAAQLLLNKVSKQRNPVPGPDRKSVV